MRKTWLVARHHFVKEASKRSFIFVLLCLPLFMVVTIGFGYLFSRLDRDTTVLGYVDRAGIVTKHLPDAPADDTSLLSFDSRDGAMEALESGEIDAFYVIAEDYRNSFEAELVFYEVPSGDGMRMFEDTLRLNLLSGAHEGLLDRLLNGADLSVKSTETNREYASGNPSFGHFLPLMVAAIIGFLVLTTSGYLTEVIVEEKENRTVEIVVTSLSTEKMMAGKIMGAVGIALVQLATWILFLVGAIYLGGQLLNISWLQSVQVTWGDILRVVIVAIPTYLTIAALMTLIGSSLADNQEANQVAMLSLLFLFIPIYALVPIGNDPNGILALGLTYFPTTSITTVALRSLFMEVPAGQIALAACISLATASILIWMTGRVFRLAMLRYGQRIRLSELIGRSRPGLSPSS